MSRLGKLPIEIPTNTEVKLEVDYIIVKGPKGELKESFRPDMVNIKIDNNQILVSIKDKNNQKQKAFWGLYRSLINNMVYGVNNGYEKKLEINGVGYRAQVAGKKLTLNLGFSHPIEINAPEGIDIEVEVNIITIKGFDKKIVGETAANIRKLRKPEPYKGKGIKYTDEIIIRKAGKAAGKGD